MNDHFDVHNVHKKIQLELCSTKSCTFCGTMNILSVSLQNSESGTLIKICKRTYFSSKNMKKITYIRRSLFSTGVLITFVIIVIYQLRDFFSPKTTFHSVTSRKFYVRDRKCNVKIIRYLNGSGLKKFQDERKSRIRDVCDMCRGNRTSVECNHLTMDEDFHNEIMYENVIVDDKHQILYCSVPKAGSTNWKMAFFRTVTGKTVEILSLLHDDEFMKYHGLYRLKMFTTEEIHKRLKTYFKFLVVRHPFERLLSAYREKFEREFDAMDPFFEEYLPQIKLRGRGNNSDVSFTNFVSYISYAYNKTTPFYNRPFRARLLRKTAKGFQWGIKQRINESNILPKGSKYFNEHWAQYSTLCHPCHIDYDYIGKLETMREDAAYVLGKLGPHYKCLDDKYPELFSVTEQSSSVFDSYFSTLTPNQIKRLKKMYSIDFKLFGYKE